jgi:hypothetical protein
MREVLSPNHWRFDEFIRLLSLEIGDGCSGHFSASVRVMERMGDVDVVGTLEQFGFHCFACCDCKVLTFAKDPSADLPKARTGFADGDDPDQVEE